MEPPGHASRVYPHDTLIVAPDGSLIHELVETPLGSCVHCTLPPGGISKAVRHRTVDEIWYVLEGQAEIWRAGDGEASRLSATAGTALTIVHGTAFQFRNTGATDLRILIVTMPPWPGDDEAEAVEGAW